MPADQDEWRPRIDPATPHVVVDGEVVAVHPVTRQVHLINPAGTLLWQVLDGTVGVSTLAGEVAEAFGLTEEAALTDVTRFAESMSEAGLLAGVPGDEPDGDHTEEPAEGGAGSEDDELPTGPRYLTKPPDP